MVSGLMNPRHQTSVVGQLVRMGEPMYVTDLRVQGERGQETYSRDGNQQPDARAEGHAAFRHPEIMRRLADYFKTITSVRLALPKA
jgi:hypothetical protein